MELVLLQDLQSSYASGWARVANSSGLGDVQIGDRFREQGFGPGSEEMEVAGLNISAVGGASQLFFNRAANATQPMVHRLGAVMLQVGIKTEEAAAERTQQDERSEPPREVSAMTPTAPAPVTAESLGWYPLEPDEAVALEPTLDHNGGDAAGLTFTINAAASATAPRVPVDAQEPLVALKRKRGRPIGSRNKPKAEIKEEVALPAGFN
jgi:hypothetical protein